MSNLMNIDIEKTREYYKKFNDICDCNYCKIYIANIEKVKPLLCEYLRSLGIDPLKPFENLFPINKRGEKILEYAVCMYVVYGKADDEFIKYIDGTEISILTSHPNTKIEEEHFVLGVGPIVFDLTQIETINDGKYDTKVCAIKKAIDEYDPIGLLALGAPANEYMQEVTLIANIIANNDDLNDLPDIIYEVFLDQFMERVSFKLCKKIADKIMYYIDDSFVISTKENNVKN